MRVCHFLLDFRCFLGGDIRLKSTIFKEEFVLIHKQIHKVIINVENLDPCKDIVFLPPIQDKEIVPKGQT